MKSLALVGCIIIVILGSIQAQFHEQPITFPTKINTLERDSVTPLKTLSTKEDIDPFPISEAEMMKHLEASHPSISENNTAINMEWALVRSDIPKKKKK